MFRFDVQALRQPLLCHRPFHVIWQCNHKFGSGKKCATPHLNEDEIKKLFLKAANAVIYEKEQFITVYEQVLSKSLDSSKLDNELADLTAEMNIASELMEKCIAENEHTALDQDDYQKRYNFLSARFDMAKSKQSENTDLNVKGTDEPTFILGHRLIYLTSGGMEPTIKTGGFRLAAVGIHKQSIVRLFGIKNIINKEDY